METCENCGRSIGNLETPQLFQNHVVCVECLNRLKPDPSVVELEPAEDPPPLTERMKAVAGEKAKQFWNEITESREDVKARSRSGLKTREIRYVDHLLIPRLIILLVAFGMWFAGSKEAGWIFFGAWVALGLANLVMKALHKQRN